MPSRRAVHRPSNMIHANSSLNSFGAEATYADRSPRANSYAERFVGTLRRECWDHVLILGERHLRKILAEYAWHYNGHWPHQGLEQKPPLRQPGHATDITARIERRQVLGGLISEYRRAAWRAQRSRSAVMSKFWHGTEPPCRSGLRAAPVGGAESHSQMEGSQAEDRHNPLPHIALLTTALKSAYSNTTSLSTRTATELRELLIPGGREWRFPELLFFVCGHGGIA